MKIALVQPREVIDLVAGMVGLLFDQFDGDRPAEREAQSDSASPADDLTKINGIGPAFARRLAQSGIATYAQLADMTAQEVRQRAQLADWQGDPENWIDQASKLSKR